MKPTILLTTFLVALQFSLMAQIRIYSHRDDQYISNVWAPVDTTHYTYSGNRGGVNPEDNQPLGFDNGNQYKWQGSAWQPSQKTTNTYDAANKTLSETVQNYINGNWRNYYRYLFAYDANENELTDNYQGWDTLGNWWHELIADTFTYNAQNLLITQITFDSAGYIYGALDSFVYNGAGEAINRFSYEWDTTHSNWGLPYQDVYVNYNAAKLLSDLTLQWNGSSWVNSANDTSVYDNNGNLLSQTLLAWNTTFWATQMQYIYRYDAGNNEITRLINYPDPTSTTWVPYSLDSFVYDGNHNPLLRIEAAYITGTGWTNNYMLQKTFNSANKVLSVVGSNWSNSAWVPASKSEYTYDANNNQTSLTNYNYQNGNWVPTTGANDWYTDITEIATVAQYTETRLYPNPNQGRFEIDFNTEQGGDAALLLYDIAGKLITTTKTTVTPGANRITWDAFRLEKGTYLYQLQIPGAAGNGKVIIE
jgi:hypothetical protein